MRRRGAADRDAEGAASKERRLRSAHLANASGPDVLHPSATAVVDAAPPLPAALPEGPPCRPPHRGAAGVA